MLILAGEERRGEVTMNARVCQLLGEGLGAEEEAPGETPPPPPHTHMYRD